MDVGLDPAIVRGWIAERRAAVAERVAALESQLARVRVARGEWTDEEHDPEGFSLTFEWSHAEGAIVEHRTELRELDAAEARLDADAYGVCDRCGEPIPAAQLELRPARTTCVACMSAQR